MLIEDAFYSVSHNQRKNIQMMIAFFTLISLVDSFFMWHPFGLQLLSPHGDKAGRIPSYFLILYSFPSFNNWTMNLFIIYITAVGAFYLSECNRLSSAFQKIRKAPVKQLVIREILIQTQNSKDMIDRINRSLGFCPLFIIGYMFLLTPGDIMYLKTQNRMLPFTEAVYFGKTLFISLAFIFAADFIESRHDELKDRLKEVLFLDPEYNVLSLSLVQALDQKVGFTAWNLFDVNKKTLLAFSSAMITFTVLFNQLDVSV